MRTLAWAATVAVLALAIPRAVDADSRDPALPPGLETGKLLYQAAMASADDVKGWVMEGPGEVAFKDGWMDMQSPGEAMHHVFWCPKRFPASFIAQWKAQNLETDAGLCIVFFAAAGLDGGSIFADGLPKRDGTFKQYTKGEIRCYHTSYYANAAHNPDRRQTNLRKNPGFHLVAEGFEGIPTRSKRVHTITLAKNGARIRLWVDRRKVIDYTDRGTTGGTPHTDGHIGFRQMKWTHFRYRNLRVWDAKPVLAGGREVSDAAVARRRKALLAEAAKAKLHLGQRNPKGVNPLILARLAVGKADEEALAYLPKGARFRNRGSMFGMASLARIVGAYADRLPEDVRAAIRRQVTGYPHFLDGGTENHRAMKRAAGIIFGERWPDATFHHGISGRELAEVCKTYLRDYGRQVYASSMLEYLSPVYHTTNTNPWLTVAECARDPESRLMARAVVDWMMADLALNCHHLAIVPPLMRSKAMIKGYPGNDRHHLGAALSTAWMYWGTGAGSALATHDVDPATVTRHAQGDYVPHRAIRNLGAGYVDLPMTIRQSRASWGTIEGLAANPFDYAARDVPEIPPADPRFHLRSAYVDREYALGAGYFREYIRSSFYRTSIPFGAVWKSEDKYARLIVGHPYWYVDYKPEPLDEPSPEDMWSGLSPFQQMVHWENAAVLLFDIPDRDPYQDVKLRWGPRWAPPARREKPLQACFAWFPESVDEKARTDAGYFLREGDVYVAVRPLRETSRWNASAMRAYSRIDMPGGLTGCVVEIGGQREYGAFEAFQAAVAEAELDTSALAKEKRVTYVSTRGHRLAIRYNDDGWRPEAAVNGRPIDYDTWPICESPYLTCRDRVLDVHDGRCGMTVDWREASPEYTYYEVEDGVRRETGREFIGPDGTPESEGG